MASNYKQKQEELDVLKWLESEASGQDRCGDYDYCPMCHLEDPQPCARAYERFVSAIKLENKAQAEKKAKAKTAAAKPAAKPAAKTAAPKSAATKKTAKK